MRDRERCYKTGDDKMCQREREREKMGKYTSRRRERKRNGRILPHLFKTEPALRVRETRKIKQPVFCGFAFLEILMSCIFCVSKRRFQNLLQASTLTVEGYIFSVGACTATLSTRAMSHHCVLQAKYTWMRSWSPLEGRGVAVRGTSPD